jgi:hypothetical protein
MSKLSKITIGVSLASGALLAAWLLTGSRKEKTKKIITKGTETIRKTLKKDDDVQRFDDTDVHYV